ncbi:tail fiber protein [Brevundimonas sp. A19_0]|uniref:tail fiber protein n=1 Tax=Brevundimonas sp. A19_0 TaxID=2821087 RepID=UPI001ADC0CBE|nr:tail fiber protein [Brevundimonas sp. A19_0]MBO9500756.1 tail fiber protein [Brevundimonas sp. A19_0]
MPGLPITITDAGRAALINAQNTGTNALTIHEIALTSSNMEGANFAAMTALPTELKRLTTFSGDVVAADTLHLTIRDESIQSYSMRGFGLILSDGTLFAVYGQAAPIVQKSTASIMLLAVDVVLASLTTAMIEFGNTDFINPPATVDQAGVIKIATQPEVDAGARSDVAVPPSRLKVLLTALLGTKADVAHSHDAGHVTSGVFDVARIPDLVMGKITGLAVALAEKANLAGATFTGVVAIAAAGGGRLDIRGNAGTVREINFKTDVTDRWRIRANGSAESGANNGALLEFMRFADNGAYLGIPFAIVRATGQVTFETVPRVGTQQVWFEGNFDPNSKAAAIHSHDWAQVTGKPVLLQFVNSLAVSGSDLNLCTTPGFYRQPLDAGATDGANYPIGAAGMIEVLAQGNAVEQRYTRPSSGDVFHRGSIGGAWSAWRKFWDSGNFNPASKLDASAFTFANLGGKPNTLAGYGITNAVVQYVGAISSGQDLNDYVTTGIYHQSSNSQAASGANYPTPAAGLLEVYGLYYTYQRYTTYNGNESWWRTNYSGTWYPWRKVSDSTHAHGISEIPGLQAALDAKLAANAYSLISQAEAEAGTATTVRYVSALRIRQAIAAFASPLGHSHGWGEISGKPDFFAPSPHSHAIGDVTGLQVALDAKLAANAYSLIGQAEAEAGTATTVRYFTAQRVRQAIAAFASPLGHAHAWTEITGKPSTFTPSAHTHAAADVTSGVFDVARIPNLTASKITDLLDLVWPAGQLHLFDQATVPAGTRCLVANGAVVSRTTYARLFAAIGTRYGAGDGATTFQIPDWRGLFFRGLDNGRGLDPGRALGTGSYQASQNLQHRHSIAARSSTGSNDNYVEDGDSDGVGRSMFTGYEGGSEARPVNEALLACISY